MVRVFIFGEPVTKPLSESSVCYWKFRKQADVDLARVRAGENIVLGFMEESLHFSSLLSSVVVVNFISDRQYKNKDKLLNRHQTILHIFLSFS